jgi:hypothetical protein
MRSLWPLRAGRPSHRTGSERPNARLNATWYFTCMDGHQARINWPPRGRLSRVDWARLVMALNGELMEVCRHIVEADRAGAATVLLARREAIITDHLRQLWALRENEL